MFETILKIYGIILANIVTVMAILIVYAMYKNLIKYDNEM